MARRISHSLLRPAHDHLSNDHHDDFGGLLRDLVATGSRVDRRQLLRLAASFGVGTAALQLMGCGGSTPSSPSPSSGGNGTGSSGGTFTDGSTLELATVTGTVAGRPDGDVDVAI